MTKSWRISRRTMLRGTGAAIALPWLEAMQPAIAGSASTARMPPLRMAFIYHPIGAETTAWQGSTGEGKNFRLSPTLSVLEPVKEHLTVIEGLVGRPHPRVGHVKSCSLWLSSAPPGKTDAWGVQTDATLDQIVAPKLSRGAAQNSLELSCNHLGKSMHSLYASWRKPGVPMGAETDHKAVFARMFGDPKKDFYRQSVLDAVSEDAKRLQRNLSHSDRGRLDEYLSSVRSLERQIAAVEKNKANSAKLKRPTQQPQDLTQYVRLMGDLMVIALQTDFTRVVTSMPGNGGFATYRRRLVELGIDPAQFKGQVDAKYLGEGHHSCTHKAKQTRPLIRAYDRWYVQQLLYVLQKMQSIREGENTLLDNSLVVYGCGNGGGNGKGWPGHGYRDVACLLAGKAGGLLQKTGRRLQFPERTPLSNLWLTLCRLVGVERREFGLSTGSLSGLG